MYTTLMKRLGWATPVAPGFEPATLASRLGHLDQGCLAERQGRCPGAGLCADCPWAEGVSRPVCRPS